MSDNNEIDGEMDSWLTPSQVSKEFNIVQRRVYRWIEREEVVYRSQAGRKFVNRDSVENLLRQEQIGQFVSSVVPKETPSQDLRESVTTSLVRSDTERSQLYAKSLDDARTIGELTQKTLHMETMEIEVKGLRGEVIRLTGGYERFRVLFVVAASLFVAAVIIFSVILYWFL